MIGWESTLDHHVRVKKGLGFGSLVNVSRGCEGTGERLLAIRCEESMGYLFGHEGSVVELKLVY